MIIAVHHCDGTFSNRWLAYLSVIGVPHVLVDAYADDIVEKMRSFDALMWNWTLHHPAGLRHARSVTRALEAMGKVVFPDSPTAWHYDDKIAQKYLLEAAGAPLVPTHVFHDRDTALAWCETAVYPIVFKLSSGAGSYNVRLVETVAEARRLVALMFDRGQHPAAGYMTDARTKIRRLRSTDDVLGKIVRLPSSLLAIAHKRRTIPREIGHVLLQEFVPGNDFDTRVVTIGDRAFGLRRFNRSGDFRASGSGRLDFRADQIDQRCVAEAFIISTRLGFQCMAYDFLLDREGDPVVVEISYCFSPGEVYRRCEGYWDESLSFHSGCQYLEDEMVDLVVNLLRRGHGRFG